MPIKTKNKKKLKKKKSINKKIPSKKKKVLTKKKKSTIIKKKKILNSTKKVNQVIKKKKNIKSSKNAKLKKPSLKVKKVIKSTLKPIRKKREKKIINFDDHIKGIVTKLIEKYKIDGVYTNKIIEKKIPKKFRIPENVLKVTNVLKQSNLTIVSEKEAAELAKIEKESKQSAESSSEDNKKQSGKTDDPVRLYLRDMGAVELLSREGEIAIAKRIEAGREKMIGAICESPMTMRSIINWKESIKEGTMLLRDIVDLEQTYDMSDIGDSKIDDTLSLIEGVGATTKENKKEEKPIKDKNENTDNSETITEDDEEGLNVSLAAMEEKLKPKVLKDFDEITKLFKKLQK